MLNTLSQGTGQGEFYKGLNFQMINQRKPVILVYDTRVLLQILQLILVNVPYDIETPLLESVDKVYERAGGSWIGDQKQYLRPPKLDMGFPQVKEKQILSDLVKQKCLVDVTPILHPDRGQEVQGKDQGEAK